MGDKVNADIEIEQDEAETIKLTTANQAHLLQVPPQPAEAQTAPQSALQKTLGVAGTIGLRLRDQGYHIYQQGRPMSEMVDYTNFSRPSSANEAVNRIQKNYRHFRINYAITVCGFIAVALILNPKSLLVLSALMLSWIYVFVVRAKPLVIGGRQFGEREQVVGMSILTLIIIFFATSVGRYLLYSLIAGIGITAAHAALRQPDDLFVDDQPENTGSILSFFQQPQSQQLAFAV